MSLISETSRSTSVRCMYGPDRAAIAPDTFTVHLFTAHPDAGGVEISATTVTDDGEVPNGYAAATVLNDDFTLDDVGVSVDAVFPPPTAGWQPASYLVSKDPVTGQWWEAKLLTKRLRVTGIGPAPVIRFTIFFDNNVSER